MKLKEDSKELGKGKGGKEMSGLICDAANVLGIGKHFGCSKEEGAVRMADEDLGKKIAAQKPAAKLECEGIPNEGQPMGGYASFQNGKVVISTGSTGGADYVQCVLKFPSIGLKDSRRITARVEGSINRGAGFGKAEENEPQEFIMAAYNSKGEKLGYDGLCVSNCDKNSSPKVDRAKLARGVTLTIPLPKGATNIQEIYFVVRRAVEFSLEISNIRAGK